MVMDMTNKYFVELNDMQKHYACLTSIDYWTSSFVAERKNERTKYVHLALHHCFSLFNARILLRSTKVHCFSSDIIFCQSFLTWTIIMNRLLLVKSDAYELGEVIGQGAYGYVLNYKSYWIDWDIENILDAYSKVEM